MFRTSMYQTQKTPRGRGRMLAGLFAALLCLSFALGALNTTSADAATFDQSGYPGTASFPKAYAAFQGGYQQLYPNNYWVTRSQATTSTQYVRVTFRAWGWDASTQRWVFDKSYVSGRYLTSAQSGGWVNFNGFNPLYRNTHVDVLVTWQDGSTSTWRTVGVRHADYTSVDDYVAGSGAQIFANSYVGAYIHYL
jgi:hypothetical protein